jgi:DNA repair protein RecO (recombination protein O)
MKYNKLTGVILKKQNYREADQILTVWTKELGKVRVLARGLRHGKSKLSFSAQDLSVVEFETAGRKSMPSLISAKSIKNFLDLREELSKSVAAFYAAELIMKMTPDEQPNEEAYTLLVEFLDYVNSSDLSEQSVFTVVDSFALRLTRNLGFSIEHAQSTSSLPQALKDNLTLLMEVDYAKLPHMKLDERLARQSHNIVRDFIEFILERNLKSDQFLAKI